MSLGQIADYKGTLGRSFPANAQANQRVRMYRNVSTAFGIPVGCVVVLSTLTTDGTGVTKSTVIGNPLTAGVALTSAPAVSGALAATSAAASDDWFQVVTEGPARVIVTTASSPGTWIHSGNDTGFAGTTAGVAQTVSTVGTTAVGNFATLGRLIKASSDTNTTGQLGVVDVNIGMYFTASTHG